MKSYKGSLGGALLIIVLYLKLKKYICLQPVYRETLQNIKNARKLVITKNTNNNTDKQY